MIIFHRKWNDKCIGHINWDAPILPSSCANVARQLCVDPSACWVAHQFPGNFPELAQYLGPFVRDLSHAVAMAAIAWRNSMVMPSIPSANTNTTAMHCSSERSPCARSHRDYGDSALVQFASAGALN